jgi:hypothetical protein
MHDYWVYLQPRDEHKAALFGTNAAAGAAASKDSSVSKVTGKSSGEYDPTSFTGLGAVRIQVQFMHSEVGELFSHFREKEWDPDTAPQFDVNTFYAVYLKLYENLVGPILKLIFDLLDIMYWTHVWWSALHFIGFLFLCYNRDYIPSASHLPWIYYMVKGYMKLHYKKYQDLAVLPAPIKEEKIAAMTKAETANMSNNVEKAATEERTIENSLGTIGTMSNMVCFFASCLRLVTFSCLAIFFFHFHSCLLTVFLILQIMTTLVDPRCQ